MNSVLTSVLSLLTTVAPLASKFGATGEIISTVIQIAPTAIKEIEDVGPIIKNIIASLKGGDITEDQWNQLEALEAQIDKEFDDAARDAQAEDKA